MKKSKVNVAVRAVKKSKDDVIRELQERLCSLELESAEDAIANALYHRCGSYIDCKSTELEEAASIIIEYLKENGFGIVRIS